MSMDFQACLLVETYVQDHLKDYQIENGDPIYFQAHIVWKCKALQNWKYLLATSLNDGMYYEATWDGDKNEWILDVYKKVESRRLPDDLDDD